MPSDSAPSKPFRYRHVKAQAALEFALAFPILLMVLFGIIDFSLLFAGWLAVENVARQTVRVAATGAYEQADCVDSTADSDTLACGGNARNDEVDKARIIKIHRESEKWRTLIFFDDAAPQFGPQSGYFKMTVCSGEDTDTPADGIPNFAVNYPHMGGLTAGDYAGCYNTGSPGTPTEDVSGPGYKVVIMVDYNHPYMTPFFSRRLALFPPGLLA
jgi:hypothetical protein